MSTVNKFSVKDYLNEHISLVNSINENSILNALNLISETIENQKKIITCGNGGSATTASHYITDWNKMYNIFSGVSWVNINICFKNEVSSIFIGMCQRT